MPTIYKPKKQSNDSDKRKLRQKLYHDKLYRDIRLNYLQCHPCCERCEAKGLTVAGEDVHHKKSPYQDGLTMEERYERLRDENNLEVLCRQCHDEIHNPKRFTIYR